MVYIAARIICVAQINKSHFALTEQDKRNYTLSIDQHKIGKLCDTIYYKKHYGVIWINVKLFNHSNDTLNYINMTCGENEIYTTSNKDMINHGWACEYNVPHEVKLPPHRSSALSMPIFIAKNGQNNYSFKIGMYICKYRNTNDMRAFEEFLIHQKFPSNCLIWSNEVNVAKR
jgi:hypothetical protein